MNAKKNQSSKDIKDIIEKAIKLSNELLTKDNLKKGAVSTLMAFTLLGSGCNGRMGMQIGSDMREIGHLSNNYDLAKKGQELYNSSYKINRYNRIAQNWVDYFEDVVERSNRRKADSIPASINVSQGKVVIDTPEYREIVLNYNTSANIASRAYSGWARAAKQYIMYSTENNAYNLQQATLYLEDAAKNYALHVEPFHNIFVNKSSGSYRAFANEKNRNLLILSNALQGLVR